MCSLAVIRDNFSLAPKFFGASSVNAVQRVPRYLRRALVCAQPTCDSHRLSCLKPLMSLTTLLFSRCLTKIKSFPANNSVAECSARWCFHARTMGNRWLCLRFHLEAHYGIISWFLTLPPSFGVWGAWGRCFLH